MRYELLNAGNVYQSNDIQILRNMIDDLVGYWELFENGVESKMCDVPFETSPPKKAVVSKYPENIDGRKVRPRTETRPTLLIPVLTYDQVLKAAHWSEDRVGKQTIANRLYCSLAQVTRSLLWYNTTTSQEEYENYGPHKKSLAESK